MAIGARDLRCPYLFVIEYNVHVAHSSHFRRIILPCGLLHTLCQPSKFYHLRKDRPGPFLWNLYRNSSYLQRGSWCAVCARPCPTIALLFFPKYGLLSDIPQKQDISSHHILSELIILCHYIMSSYIFISYHHIIIHIPIIHHEIHMSWRSY